MDPQTSIEFGNERRNGEPSKKPWVAPEVLELPRLTDLTLQTGSPIEGGGGTGGGGSTVF